MTSPDALSEQEIEAPSAGFRGAVYPDQKIAELIAENAQLRRERDEAREDAYRIAAHAWNTYEGTDCIGAVDRILDALNDFTRAALGQKDALDVG